MCLRQRYLHEVIVVNRDTSVPNITPPALDPLIEHGSSSNEAGPPNTSVHQHVSSNGDIFTAFVCAVNEESKMEKR